MTRSSPMSLLAFVAVLGGALACRSWAARTARGGAVGERDHAATPSAVSVPVKAPPASVPVVTTSRAPAEVVLLTVYFPSRRYVESGDDSLPRLVAERFELEVADAGAGVETLARAALAALEAGPKSAAATRAIPERVVVRHVHVLDGVAYVDFSRDGLAGGSLEETLLVRSIVRTLTGVPQVRAVQFLVEGQASETLMGHITTTEPISDFDRSAGHQGPFYDPRSSSEARVCPPERHRTRRPFIRRTSTD